MKSFVPLNDCSEANQIVTYLQESAEKARASLSRELHDDMGGLLVSAVMDVAFAEQALPIGDRVRQRLTRVRTTLTDAIDLKRKAIEQLRPSILDNFGLFEAIKWEVKRQCQRAQLPCGESYPDVDRAFSEEASIVVFRIMQETLSIALRQPSVSSTHIAVDTDSETLSMRISHDGKTSEQMLTQEDTLAMRSIAHRVGALGGQMTVAGIDGGGAHYSATLPLSRLAAAPPKPSAA
jgi:signal transduction histidine kinase